MSERSRANDAPAKSTDFDLIIVGGGSGNSIISRAFSHLSIALIDNGEHFGGTCLNAGCIPTKMFVHVADVAADARDVARLGLELPNPQVDWPALRDRIFTRIDALSEAGFRNRDVKIPNVTVFRDTFTFESSHVLVGSAGTRLRGKRIVIAAGSRPRSLGAAAGVGASAGVGAAAGEGAAAGVGIGLPGVHDSDSIMRLETLPASMVIVGGGAVAVEFAHIFSALGVAVTQIVRGQRLLGMLDDDISATFTELAAGRWTVLTEQSVAGVTHNGSILQVTLGTTAVLTTDIVLVAVGRVPNTDTLNLAAVGYDLHDDGRLIVDEQRRARLNGTFTDSIYSLGDVSSPWQLKHVANHEARVVQHNLLNAENPVSGEPGPVPAAIFSHPQVAYFGLTEAEALISSPGAIVVRRHYSTTAWGWSLEDTTSFCKLVIEASTGLILGAHIIGPEASILIQPLILAASHRLSVHGLARSMYWPHPAASEVIENALLDAEKLLGAEKLPSAQKLLNAEKLLST